MHLSKENGASEGPERLQSPSHVCVGLWSAVSRPAEAQEGLPLGNEAAGKAVLGSGLGTHSFS